MATAKVKLYPYVVLNAKGKLHRVCVSQYSLIEKFDKDVDCFFLNLPELEVEIECPDENQLRDAAAKLITQQMADERAKFFAGQTLMQAIHNDLLRLEAPDIIDAVPKAKDDMQQFGDDNHHDDDIPF